MERTLSAIAAALLLAAAGCAQQTTTAATTPTLAVSQMHTPWGAGPVAYPTSIYDPSLLNDPSLIEDQPHNRGNKSTTSGPMTDPSRSHRG
jgi:hypothetical protein